MRERLFARLLAYHLSSFDYSDRQKDARIVWTWRTEARRFFRQCRRRMCHSLKQCCAISKLKHQEANAIQVTSGLWCHIWWQADVPADDILCVQYSCVRLCLRFFTKSLTLFFPSFFVYMCKCCSGARSVSQKCKIKGKWKSGRRWKRAIRLATVEWVSAMLSDIARRHYQLLASVSLNRHPAAEQWSQQSDILWHTITSSALCISLSQCGCKARSSRWQSH